jgi:hypothetical protein
MTTLADLTRDDWTPVARKVRGLYCDVWQWLLPLPERGPLQMAREAGTVLTVQVRGTDGEFRLFARLAKPATVRVWGRRVAQVQPL